MKASNSLKIHLLIVVRHPIGGIRTFIRYVYTKFDIEKYKFFLVLPETSELLALQRDLEHLDCEFVVLEKDSGMLAFQKNIFKIIKNKKIDLVHSHGFTSLVYASLPARITRKPHLFTSHDVFTDKQFNGIKGMFKRIMLGTCFHFVDIIHSVSRDAQENLLAYFPTLRNYSSKLVVIPNGIETKRFLIDEREDWRKRLNLDEQIFLIGFFGRFMAQKGFKYLVEAMETMSKLQLEVKPVVLAFGWGGYIREEQAEIKQKGLSDHFLFLPFQENPARAMRGLDIVAIPSLWEACPLLPMEVVVAGIPIVGTDCIGLREVLKNTPAKVVPVADGKALAEALIAEMSNSTKEDIKQFRGEATRRFDVKNQVEKLETLIVESLYKFSNAEGY